MRPLNQKLLSALTPIIKAAFANVAGEVAYVESVSKGETTALTLATIADVSGVVDMEIVELTMFVSGAIYSFCV